MSYLDTFSDLVARCDRLQGQLQAVEGELRGVQVELIDLQDKRELYTKAVEALKVVVEHMTERDLKKIEDFVTMGLQKVIDDQKISCKVVAEGSSKVHITGRKGDFEGPFVDSFGGGVWNVASFILRIIAILRLKLRRRIFLDESFNNLHVGYLENLGELMSSLVNKLGFKCLLITHQERLAECADRVYVASLRKGFFVLDRTK